MTAPVLITADMLRAKGALCDQVKVFEATFPEGTAVTLESVDVALAAGLGVGWFASRFLSAKLWAELKRQCAPFRAEYERATLRAEYERRCATLFVAMWEKRGVK